MATKWCDWTTGLQPVDYLNWVTATSYVAGDLRKGKAAGSYVTVVYRALSNHTSAAADEPGVGANWATYWEVAADGSQTKPYKTWTSDALPVGALTGGDEVRLGKSPGRTNTSVSLTWTYGSTSVTATGDITAEIPVGAMIGKQSAGAPGSEESFYRVSVCTYAAGTTTITLNSVYCGTTETAASCVLGVTDIGSASLGAIVVAGLYLNPLIISGGWDLSTGQRTGETWFYGAGTQDGVTPTGAYLTLQHFGLCRVNQGVISGSITVIVSHVSFCLMASGVRNVPYIRVDNCCFCGITSSFYYNDYARVRDSFFLASPSGFVYKYGSGGVFTRCTARYVGYMVSFDVNRLDTLFYECSASDYSARTFNAYGTARFHSFGAADAHYINLQYGLIERNTADAMGGSGACLQFTPASTMTPPASTETIAGDLFPIPYPATAGSDFAITFYAKKSAAFSGHFYVAGLWGGAIAVEVAEITLTTDYVQYTVTIPAALVDESGPQAAIRFYVRGTGYVCIDSIDCVVVP